MWLLIIISVLKCYGIEAIPITTTSILEPSSLRLDRRLDHSTKTRSTFEILWSCWTTIFICTWTSMHPNIPPRRQSLIRALWRKTILMVCALLVPELVLTWAVKQWLAAKEIEKQFKNDHNWTRVHAHFLGMGGFTLADVSRCGVAHVSSLNMPTLPKKPALPKEVEGSEVLDWERYLVESETYRGDRRRFWTGWEEVQRNCSDYAYSDWFRDRKLQSMDREDYKRYETFGQKLPDHIIYMRELPGTLSYYRFKDLVDEGIIAFPTTTDAEIHDRSKGDFLSKAIAVVHTTWFLVQCVARAFQGLAITELELVTIALASLNGITYFFWWDKPLSAQEPVTLYFRGVIPVETGIVNQGFFSAIFSSFRVVLKWLVDTFNSPRAFTSRIVHDRLREIKKEISNNYFSVLKLVPYWLVYLPIATIVNFLYTIIDTSDIPPGATHVPMFYATNVNWSNLDDHFIFFGLPVIAAAFGGLHCIGWNYSFPTIVEQNSWRISSLCITVIPLVTGFVWYASRTRRFMKVLLHPALALLVVYIIARLSLLTQALVSLRSEPESAYLKVEWTKYLPHIS